MMAFPGRVTVTMRVACVVAAVAVGVASPAAAAPTAGDGGGCRPATGATTQDVGTLGGYSTTAVDMNDQGVVVGVSDTATSIGHAFRWHRGVMTDLTPTAEYGTAIDVNDRGQVLFRSYDEGSETFALWSRRGVTELPGQATALNDRGEVLLDDAVWRRGTVTPILPPGPGRWATPYGIGEGGHVYGVLGTYPEPGGGHPGPDGTFVWLGGATVELAPGFYVHPVGIDRSGTLLGLSQATDGTMQAVLWGGDGDVVLPSLAGTAGAATFPAGINQGGDAVGWSVTASGERHAVLWRDGQVVDLHGPGVSSQAEAIGPRGHVAGTYVTADGATRLFLSWCGHTTDLGLDVVSGTIATVNARGQVLVGNTVVTPTLARS